MSYEHVRRPSKGNFKQELFHRSPPLVKGDFNNIFRQFKALDHFLSLFRRDANFGTYLFQKQKSR